MTGSGKGRDPGVGAPGFEPHPWVRGGHAQTIAGMYWPGGEKSAPTVWHRLALGDGDALVLWDSRPRSWSSGCPVIVLVHGLGGCANSSYMGRLASRWYRLGARVIRMNLRGAGPGFGLARGIYHAGRTDDLRAVLEWCAADAPGSPISAVGFSLGAQLTLRLATEIGIGGSGRADNAAILKPLPAWDSFLAANPPLELSACCRQLAMPHNQIYNRSFVAQLRDHVTRLHARFPDLGPVQLEGVRSVYDFDDQYTAPRNGFANAEDYYGRCSLEPTFERIGLPGLIVHAWDDPFIPQDVLRRFVLAHAQRRLPAHVELEVTRSGGHLGYISRHRWGGTRRWLDARLTSWLTERWLITSPDFARRRFRSPLRNVHPRSNLPTSS